MYTYLALGDSYTCGTSVPPEQSFPMQLTSRLRASGISIADPKIVAANGWPTDELQQGIADEHIEDTFDLVTLLIGVNNQYDGVAEGHTLESYQFQLADLLQTAIRFARNQPEHVIVLSIPDWGAAPSAEGNDRNHISAEIDVYNAANKQESMRQGVQYIDITPISRQALHDPALIAGDGRHPSPVMYAMWVDLIIPNLTLK